MSFYHIIWRRLRVLFRDRKYVVYYIRCNIETGYDNKMLHITSRTVKIWHEPKCILPDSKKSRDKMSWL